MILPDLALFVASVALIWWLGHVEVAEGRLRRPGRSVQHGGDDSRVDK